jgi:hypothetical protein
VPTAAEPGSRLDGTCSSLAAASLFSALIPGGQLTHDTATSDIAFGNLRYLDSGLHECRWEVAGGTPGLSLAVLADGAEAYAATRGAAVDATTVYDTIGESSALRCDDHSAGFVQCSFGFSIDGYWIDGFYDASQSPLPFAQVVPTLEAALQLVAAHLHELGNPLPRWNPPQALSGDKSCGSLDPSGVVPPAAGLGAASVASEFGGLEDYAPIYNYLDRQSTDAGCVWSTADGQFEIYVSVAGGASWAWDELSANAVSTLTVSGSSHAIRYETENQSGMLLLVEDSVVDVYYYPRTDEARSRVIAGITALLPQLPLSP